jgi:5,10-methylenetetrahydromethanopterin reductase
MDIGSGIHVQNDRGQWRVTGVEISCSFATSLQTPDHIVAAERLGYRRAWCYDSPALYPDVWMVLALAAQRTRRIGLGPGVLVPSLRHPMVNAAATAALAELAPGRVAVAVGSGFSGRLALGRRPQPWTDVAAYVQAFRALLRGQDVEWEGSTIRMLHGSGFAAVRPVEVPVLIAASGPKGLGVAGELGDGLFTTGRFLPGDHPPSWWAHLSGGTVLQEGESLAGDRVLHAAGHALAVIYHGLYEFGGRAAVEKVPGGPAWLEVVEAVPEPVRHLTIHEGHLIAPNEADRRAWAAGSWAALQRLTLTGTATHVRERLDELEATGVTEFVYQPANLDVEHELVRFARAAGLQET